MPAVNRRRFLKLSGLAVVAGTVAGVSFYHLRYGRHDVAPGQFGARRNPAKLDRWEDLYRQRWSWDSVVKGSHGWLNCRSTCNWDIFVKNGVIVREEQVANYGASEPGVPDFNPRGCQKGACYTDVMYGPSRLMYPMKRVDERGSGRWERISWDQALDEIAEKYVDICEKYGTDAVVQDLGPHFDQGATTVARTRFFAKAGATITDDWGEIGDLNMGAMLTFGFPHMGGTSDEWFLSDLLVVWMMNPSVTQIPDAHFLFEAKYNGARLVVIDPMYSATAIHADNWLPIKPGADALLGMGVAKYLWDSGAADWDYVREQTDFPILVREDNGRFLRESDIREGGKTDMLFWWDSDRDELAKVPGCEGDPRHRLAMGRVTPAIEGSWEVALADGQSVRVSTVGTLLRKELEQYSLSAVAEQTGLHLDQVTQFARDFAAAERPMILSSWGANRYLHSDLMNRAKILCLSLKGAIGKRGAGLSATGWFGMEGFELSAEIEKPGLAGTALYGMHQYSVGESFRTGMDLIMRRKTMHEVMREASAKGALDLMCGTNSVSMNYNYQGIKDVLAGEQDKLFPRPLAAYFEEAQDKDWMPLYPDGKQPKAWFTGGNNVLRRTNMTQRMLDNMWPNIELVVDVNPKLTFTGMNADYLLPAAGYYEKAGFKYPVAYAPYVQYCGAAIAPIGESRDEWEIYSLLSSKVAEVARRRKTPVLEGCGKFPVDLKQIDDAFSMKGAFGPKDTRKMNQQILDLSSSTQGLKIEDLEKTGIGKYRSTGFPLLHNQIYNPEWQGEGVLTPAIHQVVNKWRWPTLTGRQQFYIDHAWFVEAGEALPCHKPSPRAGGDHEFQLISCHARWSIHSIWRDTPIMLKLQRGEPSVYLNPVDAMRLDIRDGSWANLGNDHGEMRMRVKYSTMVRPGTAFYFHAWEPYQFPDHKSYKWVTPGLIKPLHAAGGEGHTKWHFAMYQPGTHVQDTRVKITAATQQP